MSGEIDIVNIVGSGTLGVEVDLRVLADDLDADARYEPDEHTGMHIRLENSTLITLYRTGSYHIVGVDSEEELFAMRDEFLELVSSIGLDVPAAEESFAVRNIVTTTDIGESLELNALAIGLGLEQVEYEPEQFPGLIYRPEGMDPVMLIFGSGKMVITGVTGVEEARAGREAVIDEIEAETQLL